MCQLGFSKNLFNEQVKIFSIFTSPLHPSLLAAAKGKPVASPEKPE